MLLGVHGHVVYRVEVYLLLKILGRRDPMRGSMSSIARLVPLFLSDVQAALSLGEPAALVPGGGRSREGLVSDSLLEVVRPEVDVGPPVYAGLVAHPRGLELRV